ncbi:MAG: acetyl-CoA decarbonylase/synthase complex subunit delta [Candidatus Euphemobacter frigidus]|nr:acetyl-CoA decarbonylase/synthase complex subunit delta [Candidatus Euphemobacter frigidus]MDP8276511.1 acetyl-CoA decarbonylase/synthase complex subunit delta [Candidatus Euphemobacter frigidus]
MEEIKEKWTGAVNTVTVGATEKEGGTRKSTVTIGGETTLPFLHFEGSIPYRPALALDVLDNLPEEWPEVLKEPYRDVLDNPAQWAALCEEKYGADMICLRLKSLHPDWGDTAPERAAETVQAVLEATTIPLIIWGCDDPEKDNLALPLCAQAAAGENCLIGFATEDNYKTLAVACLADHHKIVAQSPIDINIAKQVNILISEMGYKPEDIVIDPNTGALGYGIEYTYSIMERIRLAALDGDRMMAMPIICDVGFDSWRTKEAKALKEQFPGWGDEGVRGPLWEAMTAVLLLQAGGDIVNLRHPMALEKVRKQIDALMGNGE